MKKILLFGKLNDVLKEIDAILSEHFHVQLCDLRSEQLDGMLKVVEPDLVVISLVGTQEYDKALFRKLAINYKEVPVITVGTDGEKETFLKYYEDRQFVNLIRPVKNKDILDMACQRLRMDLIETNGIFTVRDRSQKKSVLIVDDNSTTLRELREMLKDDFDIRLATSCVQALASIGKHRPDLILLDYKMPVCDGKHTLEMIRADEDCKDLPVIFLTGVRDKEQIKAVLELKPQGYILKPPARDELVAAIRKALFYA